MTLFLHTAAMRPLMLEEQSQLSRPSSVRRTSQSSRDRLRHSSRRLTSELRANQRRHVSQSSSSTGDQFKTLTVDSPLYSSKSLDRFRKGLECPSLPMGPDFDEMLEKSLGDVEELLPGLPETELIELLHALADKLDKLLYPPNGDALRIRIWGKRLEDLCRFLPSSPSEHSPKQALITRAQAMMGMLFPSIAYLNSIQKWDDHSSHAGGTVILAVAFHQSLFRSLQLILIETPYLSNCAHSYIDNIIHILLSRSPNVLTVIQRAVQENWPVGQKRNLGFFLLSTNRDPKRLMDIINELQANNIAVNRKHILKTSSSLAVTKDITNAQKLYDSIPPSDDYHYIHTGIYLAARAGDSKQAQTLFDKLKARGEVDKRDIRNLLLAYAEAGHVRDVFRVFDEYFPKNDEGQRFNQPDVHHYSTAMLAHARDGDFDAVITWLEDMQLSGLQPNSYTFTTVVQAFSKTSDLQSLSDVFSKMRKLGAKPDVATYTILLGLFADRKDSESAESLYKLACEEGIIPDVRMTRSLMDAHVTSGSLEGATRVFDYLSSQPRNIRYLPLEVYNIVIKAHVLMGAPFRVVSRLFFKLQKMNLVPDKYSYSLLVMSACDAGQLRTATDIYYEMAREEEANPSVSLISAHVFTMIMSAFLRQGNKEQAKEMYDEMIERGIQPSSVTYGEIVKSYGKEGTTESLQIAEEFIQRLVSFPKEDRKWDKDDSKGKPALVQLYGPLLHSYALQRNVDECERLYGEYLEAGGKPTIAMLSYVLEAYRRSGDAEGALAIWPHITELASAVVFNADLPEQSFTARPPGIQLPLSIYIDALSYAGLHTEVALVWRSLDKNGQRFDSHNWNHFAISLIRAGQLLPAFEILEKVLLRYVDEIDRDADTPVEERDKNPTSPLSDPTDQEVVIASVPLKRTLQSIAQLRMHGTEQRVRAIERYGNSLPLNVLLEEAPDGDFIHPLQTLQKISPYWNTWRPHFSVMRTFLVAYMLLERGYIIRPVRRGELTRDNVADIDFNQRDDEAAGDMLKSLKETCPDTVALIKDFQLEEQRRLGLIAFERMYTWR
jgi:pentatricopeptide repeat-containing protein PET309